MHRLSAEIDRAGLGPVELEEGGWVRRRLCFGDDFLGFAGHFPGYPILPAVVQVLAARQLVETRLSAEQRLQEVEHAKFLQQLRPGQEILLRCRIRPQDDGILVKVQLSSGGRPAAAFTLKFAPEKHQE